MEQYLRHYVSATLDDWDDYLASAEYAMNNHYLETVENTPFFLNFGQAPRDPLTWPRGPLTAPPRFAVPAVQAWHGKMQDTLKAAKSALREAKQHQKQYKDLRRKDVCYDVGTFVLLNTRNIRLKGPSDGARKLMPKFIGPFRIIQKVGNVAYKLELPESMKRIHNVFHVSLLKGWKQGDREQPPPTTVEVEGDTLWLFEKILDNRGKGKKRQYLVKWKDFGHEHNSWEPESSFDHCRAELENYWEGVRKGPAPVPSIEEAKKVIDQTELEITARKRTTLHASAKRQKRQV